MGETLIETKSLKYQVENTQILKDISITIEKGKITSIIGPNGAGKSTLIQLLTKMLEPTSGSIKLEGKELKNYRRKELAKKIAYVPQIIHFDYEFSVEDVILMGRLPYKGILENYTKQDYEIAEEVMEKTNLLGLKSHNIGTLSGGERQRLAIARALAQKTDSIILDEPISNLDIYQQVEIMELLKKLNKEENLTILCILHDINTSLKYSNQTILLKQGKVIAMGETNSIVTVPNLSTVFNMNVNFIQTTNSKIAVY